MTAPTDAPPPAQTGLARLGPRARRRAAPRLTIALAAAGCALVVAGALVIGGDGLEYDGGDDGSNFPGIILSAAVVASGFVLLQRERSGPLATAGAVAATFGVPPLLFFLTYDENGLPPYSTEGILLVSTAAWAVAYVAGPGRGRPLFLGAASLGLWASVLQLTERVFDLPWDLLDRAFSTDFEDSVEPALPDLTTLGALSLAFAAGYLLVARRCDRRRLVGVATPLTVSALVIIPFAIGLLSGDLDTIGTGVLTVAIGLVLVAHGADVGRRATTYLGAAGVAFGLATVIDDVADTATPAGLLLIAVGAVVIVGAEALRRSTNEPDELAEDANETVAI